MVRLAKKSRLWRSIEMCFHLIWLLPVLRRTNWWQFWIGTEFICKLYCTGCVASEVAVSTNGTTLIWFVWRHTDDRNGAITMWETEKDLLEIGSRRVWLRRVMDTLFSNGQTDDLFPRRTISSMWADCIIRVWVCNTYRKNTLLSF